MKHRHRPLILAALGISCAFSAHAQEQTGAFRSDVIRNVMDRVKAKHYAPRALDDQWSAAVWKNYIRLLDPNRIIFLQEDIARLTAQQSLIDDQFNAAKTTFFDTISVMYRQRMKENEVLTDQLFAAGFDFSKKEIQTGTDLERDYPAGKKEKTEALRKQLKYQVLRNYMDQESATGQAVATDPALMARAIERVRRWHTNQFRLAAKPDAGNEKFAQYIAIATLEIDPHSVYSGPKDNKLEQQLTKRYFGLGMELGEKEADYYVKRLMPGGTAARSGQVRENDNILSISDGEGKLVPVSGLTAGEVTSMIRGEKDTDVKMILRQPGDSARTVTIKRGEVIEQENRAKSAVIEKNGKKFGYLVLPMFYLDASGMRLNGASADVAREVEKLKEQEVDGIIFDLRGNGGGSLDEVVRMGTTFMPAGPVTWLRTQEGLNRYTSPAMETAYTGPLVVMVDESSASASEIFAAVVQDRRRGLIVGPSSTFGKGTAQLTVNIGKMGDASKGLADVSYGSMRLTTQKFYRISGTSTQLNGVRPDVVFQENMQYDARRERNYAASLPCDSISLPAFERVNPGFDFDKVVALARKRAASSPAFATAASQMAQLKVHAGKNVPLDMVTYRSYFREMAAFEKNIKSAKTLPADKLLQAYLPVNNNVRPDLRKDESNTTVNREWLKNIAQDVYIDASVSILEDMNAFPSAAKP